MSLFKRKISISAFDSNGIALELPDLSGLHISFKAQKTSFDAANTCELTLWNLSESTRNTLTTIDTKIVINAGYEDDIVDLQSPEQIAFIGNVVSSTIGKGQADNATTIILNDGQKELRDVKVEISYDENIAVKTILADVANQLGFELIDYTTSRDFSYQNGFSYVGVARKCIEKLVKRLKATWSIQNNKLQVLNKNGNTTDDPVEVKELLGMVGSPIRLDDIGERANGEQARKGWKVMTRIRPTIQPGGRVKLTSDEVNGSIFQVWSVLHIADNFETNDFTTECELVRPIDA